MNPSADKHLDRAVTLIAVAESGDAKRAAYEQAADEILAAKQADPALTQRAIADRLGRGQADISRLLTWRHLPDQERAQRMPHNPNPERHHRYVERQVPTRHDDRVEMAEKLLADPDVVKAAMPRVLAQSSRAQRLVEQAVHLKDAEERKRDRERADQRAKDGAMPLSAYMAQMVVKIGDWTRSLQFIHDELGELDGRGAQLVADVHRRLIEQAERNVAVLDPPPADASFIEGRVSGGR